MVNKVLLFQLAFKATQTEWITDSGGIWFIPFREVYSGIDSDLLEELTEKSYLDILSVTYNNMDLTEVLSYTDTIDGRATALSVEASYIWDNVNKNLYIRLENYDDPRIYTIYIGIAIHISDQTYDDTVNRLPYREDIIGYPDLAEEKDPLFFQKISYDEFSVTLNNASLHYDYMINNKVFGQVGQYYWGEQDALFSAFDKIKEAKVKSYQYKSDKMLLRLIDSRAALSRSVPVNALTVASYPDLSDDYIGAFKPLVYGQVRDMKCIPLDDGATQTNYTFLIADTEYHNIKSSGYTIYMDGTNKTSEVINFSAANGTFQLPAAHYDIGKDVTFTGGGFVDGSSIVIENPLDIIIDLMTNYLGIAYTSNTFNTTEWEETEALLYNAAIAIQESMTIMNIIEILCSGTGVGFLLERDGMFTARYYDPDLDPCLTIHENQWLETPDIVSDESEILSSVTVKYNQAINSGNWSKYTDDSQEADVYDQFNIRRNRVFETNYSTAAGAQAFAESIMNRSNDVQTIVLGSISDKYVDLTVVKVGKIAQIEINRQTDTGYSEWIGKINCEIIGVYPDLENRKVDIKFRKITDIDDFVLNRFRITGAGDYRITSTGDLRITGVL